jgi:hypothetical protein
VAGIQIWRTSRIKVWWFTNLPDPSEPARGSLAGPGTGQWRQRLTGLFAGAHLLAATNADRVGRSRGGVRGGGGCGCAGW